MFRKHIIALLISSMMPAIAAATERPDTLLHAHAADVTITETVAGLRVDARTDSFVVSVTEPYPADAVIKSHQSSMRTLGARLGHSRQVEWELISGSFMFGFTNALGAPRDIDFEMGKSFEISWLNTMSLSCRIKSIHSRVSAGIGITWRYYRTTTGMRLIAGEGCVAGFEPFDGALTPKYSRLKVFSLSFPILFTHYFHIPGIKGTAVQAGPVLNLNTHSSLQSRWLDADGRKQTQTVKSIGQRRFTVDLYASVALFEGLGLYVRWSPQSVLRNCPQLDGFTTLSTGFILGL